VADGLQHLGHAERGELTCQHRLIPRGGHKRLRRQIVDLVWIDGGENGRQRELIQEIPLVKFDSLSQVSNSLKFFVRRAADNAVNFVTFFQQQLRQIAAVLTCNSSDECLFHSPSFPSLRAPKIQPWRVEALLVVSWQSRTTDAVGATNHAKIKVYPASEDLVPLREGRAVLSF
jgi:hypothetical protein